MDREILMRVRQNIESVIRGKSEAIDLLIIGLLCDGHILLEDVPGTGKTTLAKSVAATFDLDFKRIQFTPDLLPADLLGGQVLNPQDGSFSFQPGPIFTQILLADEINRASPRTQSALLEAMNEGQVSLDGQTRPLKRPFFVIATQNPIEYQGTYPLPEAQLDRFLLRVTLGYPTPQEELDVLFDRQHSDPLEALDPVANSEELIHLQEQVRRVHVEKEVARYLLDIVTLSRTHDRLELGVSTRGALAAFRAAQARAFLLGRDFVTPDDIQVLAESTLAHRLLLRHELRFGGGSSPEVILEELLDTVAVPV